MPERSRAACLLPEYDGAFPLFPCPPAARRIPAGEEKRAASPESMVSRFRQARRRARFLLLEGVRARFRAFFICLCLHSGSAFFSSAGFAESAARFLLRLLRGFGTAASAGRERPFSEHAEGAGKFCAHPPAPPERERIFPVKGACWGEQSVKFP